MFQEKDVIMYGTQGMCRIEGIEEKNLGGGQKRYYVLKPIGDKGATIYAPTDNAHVLKKMRRLLTREEIDALIDSMGDNGGNWIENENERKERYKSILESGDHLPMIRMLQAIYAHKQAREAEGKRLHLSDERFFKDAEQSLYNEFRYVLQLSDKEDLTRYILHRLQQ